MSATACVDLESALEVSDDEGSATVHGYLAWLAIHDEASSGLIDAATLVAPVERVARMVLGGAGRAGRARRGVLLHVAADYATVAGQLRGRVGQPAAAMAWLQRGVRWAAAAGNTAAMCRILAEMSGLARVEGDEGSAASYAAAACAVDDERPWTIVHGWLYQGRVCAQRGDLDGFEQHIRAAGRLAVRFDERDRAEAPWLAHDIGSSTFHAFVAGGLRDLAARTDDRAAVLRAVTAARIALDDLPQDMHPSRLMLTVRLADTLARAGRRDDALATCAPVLPDALASGLSLVDIELRSLRAALRSESLL